MKSHLKSLQTPTTWVLLRKHQVFVSRPHPGAHSLRLGMPLSLIFKNILKISHTTREIKKLLLKREILIDGKRVKDHRRIVGLMDVINIPETKQAWRIILDYHGRLAAVTINDEKEKTRKITRIQNKKKVKKGKTQLCLLGSRTILVEKDTYATGDSIMIELPSQKIIDTLGLEKGVFIYIIGGKHTGQKGTVERIGGGMILFKNEKGDIITTLKKYALVVGKTKAAIKIQ